MRIVAVCFVLWCCLAPVTASGSDIPPVLRMFGERGTLVTGKMPSGLLPTAQRWQGMRERQKRYGPVGEKGSMPAPTFKQWQTLVSRFPTVDAAGQLRMINGFFNGWRQISDIDNYAKDEYWSSAGEFLEKGGGDCEDFALIKYTALRQLGWPSDKLWVLIVTDMQRQGQGHAVLAASLGGKPYILDNLSRPSYLIMDNAALVKRYVPVLAFNEDGFWVFPAARKASPTPRGVVQ